MTAQAQSKATQLVIGGHMVRPTPGRYGFSVQTDSREWELIVLLSGGQGGATAIGVVFAQCDEGMNVGHSTALDGDIEPTQKEVHNVVRGVLAEAGWPLASRDGDALAAAIDAGVRTTMEGWGL